MTVSESKRVRCGIYCRRSIDEEAGGFSSTQAQREACESYVTSQKAAGWELLETDYTDVGFSGGTTERPALTRLLAAIEAGEIDAVVVHRLDRLSRSLRDFARLLELFERKNVAFVSVTQSFDTSTSAGKLVLHILISFSEFERSMIRERVSMKVIASLRRGLWIGGRPVYGYVAQGRKLVVAQDEAVVVRRIFARYRETQSTLTIAQELNAERISTKRHTTKAGEERGGALWDKKKIRSVLLTPLVCGFVGCKGELFRGQHEAIVTREEWDEVQGLLKSRAKRRSYRASRSKALLAGTLKCARCGASMRSTYAAKRNRRYDVYVCALYVERGAAACPGARVSAHAVESAVVEQIKKIGVDARLLKATTEAVAPPVDVPELKERLREFSQVWEALEPLERKRALDLLVESVAFDSERGTIQIKFRDNAVRTLAAGEKQRA